MTKLRLISTPSTKGSASLRLLAQSLTQKLGYKVWRSINERPNRKSIKYGLSVDKLAQFQWYTANDISTLEYTTDKAVAEQWLTEGDTVFGRKYLNASCGKGIVVFNPNDLIDQPFPVFTKYKKKAREFRVHVYQNKVVAVTEKRLRAGYTGVRDTRIRNLANGYVFCQEVENEPAGLRELALRAAQVSPSHFRGVDIGYNQKKDTLFVIEVNSAPGIQGSNLAAYTEAITNV